MIGQGHSRIKHGPGQAWQEKGCTCEQDGCRLACGTFQAEDNACQDAGQSLGQYDAADGLPAGGAQRNADRAESLRHGP